MILIGGARRRVAALLCRAARGVTSARSLAPHRLASTRLHAAAAATAPLKMSRSRSRRAGSPFSPREPPRRAYHTRRAPRAAKDPSPTSPRRRSSLRWSLWRLTFLELPIGGVFVIPPTAFSRPSTTLTSRHTRRPRACPPQPYPGGLVLIHRDGRRRPLKLEALIRRNAAYVNPPKLAGCAQEAAQAVHAGRLPEGAPPPAPPPTPPPRRRAAARLAAHAAARRPTDPPPADPPTRRRP